MGIFPHSQHFLDEERQKENWRAAESAILPLQNYHPIGEGDPEGVVYAPQSATYHRTDGTAGSLVYVKETDGSLNTGWTAFA